MSQQIELILPQLYPAQLEVARTCLDQTTKYIVVNGSRQVGKTSMLATIAIYMAMDSKRKKQIMVVSSTDSQVKEIQQRILEILEPAIKYCVKSYKVQSGDAQIIFYNGNKMLFRSSKSENSLRGFTNSDILIDEFAYCSEEVWSTILAPSMSVAGKYGKAIFCSTPFGPNHFQRFYNMGLKGENGYKSFKITYKQNPYADLEHIENQRLMLPIEIFESEYLGIFSDSATVFKNIDLLATIPMQSEPVYGDSYFGGIDFAFKKDYTVFTLFNQLGQMVFYDRFNNIDTKSLVERIKDVIVKWNPLSVYAENNNQGLPLIDNLRDAGCYQIEDFNTNTKTKPQIINNLIFAFNKKEINIINDDIIKDEFKNFGYEISKSGNISFRANVGHDDLVMATALGWACHKNNLYTGSLIFN